MKSYSEIEDLLIKYILGECNEQETKEVQEWLSVEENRALYEKLRSNLDRFTSIRKEKANVDVDAAWNSVSSRLNLGNEEKGKVIPLFFRSNSVLRYAAAVILLIGLYFIFRPGDSIQQKPIIAETDTIEDEIIPIKEFERIASVDQIYEADLFDGSKVTLRENSQIRHQMNEYDTTRLVYLDKGEVYFEVARMPERPFIVETNTSLVRVLGTKFTVSQKENGDVEVAVTEGLVRVYKDSTLEDGEYIDLKKGERAIRNLKGLFKLDEINLNAISWITGSLKFNDAPMEQVLADLERHFHVEFTVRNASFNQCRLTAKFKKQELEQIMESLKLTFDIEYEIRNNQVIISGMGCAVKA